MLEGYLPSDDDRVLRLPVSTELALVVIEKAFPLALALLELFETLVPS